MSKVTLDPRLIDQLLSPGGNIELFDTSGELAGVFVPSRNDGSWSRLTIVQEHAEKLRAAGELVEVADVHQQVVGTFRYPTDYDYAWADFKLTKEEVQRRLKSPGRKLAEILADFEKRGRQSEEDHDR